MKKKRFSEEQIIAVLKEDEAGAKVLDLCRKHGISDATFCNWKAKYAGFIAEVKSGSPQPAQAKMPGRFSPLSGLVPARSVPSRAAPCKTRA